MKKIISILLAVITALSMFSFIAYANDNYTKAYYVYSPSAFSSKYEIVLIDYYALPAKDKNGEINITADHNCFDVPSYVKSGDECYFIIKSVGSYSMNDTSVVRAVGTDYQVESLIDEELADSTVLTPITTVTVNGTKKNEFGEDEPYEVDYDVYMLTSVTEDTYIYVTNVANESGSGMLNFINGLFNFFVNFINWFFGLAKVKM